MTPITDQEIESLRRAASLAGDDPLVHCCWVALGERPPGVGAPWPRTQDEARAECARVIADAKAMEGRP